VTEFWHEPMPQDEIRRRVAAIRLPAPWPTPEEQAVIEKFEVAEAAPESWRAEE
jgi:hypothetical protein